MVNSRYWVTKLMPIDFFVLVINPDLFQLLSQPAQQPQLEHQRGFIPRTAARNLVRIGIFRYRINRGIKCCAVSNFFSHLCMPLVVIQTDLAVRVGEQINWLASDGLQCLLTLDHFFFAFFFGLELTELVSTPTSAGAEVPSKPFTRAALRSE